MRTNREISVFPLLIVVAMLVIPCSSSAQESDSTDNVKRGRKLWSIGLEAGFQLQRHEADFTTLSDQPSCCSGFSDGGSGIGIGGAIVGGVWPFESLRGLSIGASLEFAHSSVEFSTRDDIGYALDASGEVVVATSEFYLEPRIATATFTPEVRFTPLRTLPVTLFAGVGIMTPLSTSYSEYEEVVSPEGVEFLDGNPENPSRRNEHEGVILPISGMTVDIRAGLGYDIELDGVEIGGMAVVLTPAISMRRNLNSLHQSAEWKMQAVHIGLSTTLVRYRDIGYVVPGAFVIVYETKETREAAESVRDSLSKRGIGDLVVYKIEVAGRTVYQVRSMLYSSLLEANTAIDRQELFWAEVVRRRPSIQEAL